MSLELRMKLENMSQEERTVEVRNVLIEALRPYVNAGLIRCFLICWNENNLQGKGGHIHTTSNHVNFRRELLGEDDNSLSNLDEIEQRALLADACLDMADLVTATATEPMRTRDYLVKLLEWYKQERAKVSQEGGKADDVIH